MAARKTSGIKGKTPAAKAPAVKAKAPAVKANILAKRGKEKIEIVSSQLSYDGPLFRVYTDKLREQGRELTRDVIRHNGSVVILVIDDSKNKKDPLVVLERQYRHAARQFLLELPAGKLEEGEELLAGAKRELLEETGLRAKRWRKLVRYFARIRRADRGQVVPRFRSIAHDRGRQNLRRQNADFVDALQPSSPAGTNARSLYEMK
jgi:8-oxo-dGTP pyrophosphatase MutT (NUDIX family)